MQGLSKRTLEGVIRTDLTSARTLYMSANSWLQIEDDLFRTFSTGASMFLIHLGTYYGKSITKEAKLSFTDPQGILDRLKAMMLIAGWGELSIRWRQGDERNLEMELKNCVFCSEETKALSCYFLQGVMAGALSETFGREYKVSETECCRKGADSCKLHATVSAVRETAGIFSSSSESN